MDVMVIVDIMVLVRVEGKCNASGGEYNGLR